MSEKIGRREFSIGAAISTMIFTAGCEFGYTPTREECETRDKQINAHGQDLLKAVQNNSVIDKNTFVIIRPTESGSKLFLYKTMRNNHEDISSPLGCTLIPHPEWDSSMNNFDYEPTIKTIRKFYANPTIDKSCMRD